MLIQLMISGAEEASKFFEIGVYGLGSFLTSITIESLSSVDGTDVFFVPPISSFRRRMEGCVAVHASPWLLICRRRRGVGRERGVWGRERAVGEGEGGRECRPLGVGCVCGLRSVSVWDTTRLKRSPVRGLGAQFLQFPNLILHIPHCRVPFLVARIKRSDDVRERVRSVTVP